MLKTELKLLTINGTEDARFPIATVRKANLHLQQRVPKSVAAELRADHFFFLSDIPAWRELVRESFGY